MKDVQQIRGPFEEQSVFTGLPGQLTVDETNHRLLIHDGVTPGGHILVSRDEGDTRWMEHIAELLGFANLGVGVKGFAVRQAAGIWVIRTITGDGASIEVSEGFGETGNPVIELADEVTKDIIFSGEITFDSVIQALGFIGDTQGDHTGNVLGNVTGNTTGTHTGASNGTHTGPQVGAVDVRGEEILLDADALDIAHVEGLADAIAGVPAGVPVGFIGWWFGVIANIPAGWHLCDGDVGTPDLRGQFIRCAGPDPFPAPHTSGGTETHIPAGTVEVDGVHAHVGTIGLTALTLAQTPPHAHASGVCDNVNNDVFNRGAIAANPTTVNSIESNSADGIHEGNTGPAGGSGGVAQGHNHTTTVMDGGDHAHAFTGTEAGYLPPYYCLCLIMKI